MSRQLTCVLGLSAALITAAPAPAQTALGTVRGVVLDQQGAVLPGVTITLRQGGTNTSQTVVSTPEGRYLVPNLRPGKYEVSTELPGFMPVKQELEIRVGQDLTLNLTLKGGGVA